MKLFFSFFRGFFKNLYAIRKFLPASLAGVFIMWNFFSDWTNHGINVAYVQLGKSILAAELVINEKTRLAMSGNPSFGTIDVIHIIVSFFVIYFFIRTISKWMMRSQGANENYGAYLWALLFLVVIEFSAVRIIDGHFGFIPIRDGIVFFFMNISSVFSNFHLFG